VAKKLRQEELARIMGGAPNTGSASAGTSRNKAQYSDRIRQYVRSKLVFPGADSVDGNPEAVFEVKQLPNGEIVSITQKKAVGCQRGTALWSGRCSAPARYPGLKTVQLNRYLSSHSVQKTFNS